MKLVQDYKIKIFIINSVNSLFTVAVDLCSNKIIVVLSNRWDRSLHTYQIFSSSSVRH